VTLGLRDEAVVINTVSQEFEGGNGVWVKSMQKIIQKVLIARDFKVNEYKQAVVEIKNTNGDLRKTNIPN
jgi:hypothetical protein